MVKSNDELWDFLITLEKKIKELQRTVSAIQNDVRYIKNYGTG